jgi:lysophospholipase L1-like esterase
MAATLIALAGAVQAQQTNAAVLPAELLAQFEKKWPTNRAINLVFHGHSVLAGYFVTPDVRPFEAYPHLVYQGLKKRFPLAVINVIVTAIGGETSPAGAARFERDVLPHRPDVIFVDYALNDRRVPLEKVEAAWAAMIAQAKDRKIPIILLTPTGAVKADFPNPNEPLVQRADLIRRLAREHRVPLADVSAAWQTEIAKGTPIRDLLSNGNNHPNLRGHTIAADVILELFRTMK